MNPPPLAKRLVVLTATISLLTSVAVLFVAIPKGIDEYVDTAEPTTTVAAVKGSMNSYMATLTANGTTSCAVQISPGIWVASSDGLGSTTAGTISTGSATEAQVRLLRSSAIPYLVVASIGSQRPQAPSVGWSSASARINDSHLATTSVIDCMSQQTMRVQRTPTQFADKNEVPVYVSDDVHGMAVVLNADNSVVGFVCEHNHSQWLVEPSTLANLLDSAR